jgi:hypothetical protein
MAVEAVMVSLVIAVAISLGPSVFARESSGELRQERATAASGREGGPVIEIAAPGEYQLLKLKDGTSATGRIESIDGLRFTFRTSTGALIEVEIANVASLKTVPGTMVAGEFWPADSNATRLFFAPTGRSLKKGESYFGVYEVLLPFVQYGVTDRLSIGGGTPIVFMGGSDQPFWVTPKFQVAKGRATDVSVGVLHFFNMGDASAGIAYASLTQGSADAAFTVGGGYAYASEDDDRRGQPVVMLGGEKRLSKRVKFVTENYWFSDIGLISGGFRFLGERMSVDIGLVSPITSHESVIFFPMINFVRKF